jgi:hypothetical protein
VCPVHRCRRPCAGHRRHRPRVPRVPTPSLPSASNVPMASLLPPPVPPARRAPSLPSPPITPPTASPRPSLPRSPPPLGAPLTRMLMPRVLPRPERTSTKLNDALSWCGAAAYKLLHHLISYHNKLLLKMETNLRIITNWKLISCSLFG